MHARLAIPFLSITLLASAATAQTVSQTAPVPSLSRAPQPTTPVYVDPAALASANILPPPPASGSPAEAAELVFVHRVMAAATPADTNAAQADANQEDIFLFASIFGPGFNAKSLPLTAALSEHLVNDARLINLSLKVRFGRLRPFRADDTLHPTCGLLREPSYPSGHAMNGYLLAYAMTQIVPEKSQQVLARADHYVQNRIVCGEHYPSDLVAGQEVATEIFGNILANPHYQKDLAAAREETRKALHLQ